MPDSSAVSTPGAEAKKQKKIAAIGLGATGVAGAAGLHAIKATRVENAARAAKVAEGAYEAPKLLSRLPAKKAAAVAGGAALGLHGVELVADSLAARSQLKDIQQKKTVAKGIRRVKVPHMTTESVVRANARARKIGVRLVGAAGSRPDATSRCRTPRPTR